MTVARFPEAAALQELFGEQVLSMRTGSDEHLYLVTGGPDIRGIVEHLRRDHGARIVTVFAEDRRSEDGAFFNYYVFEQFGNPQYLILCAPVHPENPEFPSLSAEIPAVNWQEREMQDWFGLKAVGHPNPRRVAMHDNWPDVHPLLKDFPLPECTGCSRTGH